MFMRTQQRSLARPALRSIACVAQQKIAQARGRIQTFQQTQHKMAESLNRFCQREKHTVTALRWMRKQGLQHMTRKVQTQQTI